MLGKAQEPPPATGTAAGPLLGFLIQKKQAKLNQEYKSIRALVSIAEIKSAEICEYCGKYGELRTTGLWFTACDEHKGNSITEKKYKELIAKKEAEKLAPEYSI